MDPIQKRELKRQAFLRLAAQRRRAGLLRGRVVVISLLCFVVLWGIVFVQMATGNDPVLSAKEKAVATRGSAAARARGGGKTDRRTLEPTRRIDGEATEAAEPAEDETTEPVEEEAAGEEAFVEEEAAVEEPEFVEEEPLVTSQS